MIRRYPAMWQALMRLQPAMQSIVFNTGGLALNSEVSIQFCMLNPLTVEGSSWFSFSRLCSLLEFSYEKKLMQQVLCENCGPKVHFIADFSWTIFADKIKLLSYLYDVTNLLNHR